jgi:hypothetical protein
MLAGFHDELPVGAKFAFAAAQRVFVEAPHGEVPVNGAGAVESELLEMVTETTIDVGQRKNGR